jgi:hypothetical protein
MQSKEQVFGGITSIPRDLPKRLDGTGPNIELISVCDYTSRKFLCQLEGLGVFASKTTKNVLIIICLEVGCMNSQVECKGRSRDAKRSDEEGG